MMVLGIETSCDETSAAVVDNRGRLLSNIIHSQQVHRDFGGVVPELASRDHLKKISSVVQEATDPCGGLEGIDLIAATGSPGLMGALLVGHSFAQGLAMSLGKPLATVNHVEAHIWASLLHDPMLAPPLVALVVSGGHTSIFHLDGQYRLWLMGRTLDDAVGEAFDKVAKMLGLGYPGGPAVEALAKESSGKAIQFPRAWLSEDSLDFSFSGLKTAVQNHLLARGGLSVLQRGQIADICRGFQEAAIDVLLGKAVRALDLAQCHSLAVVGGVAANGEIKRRFGEKADELELRLTIPPSNLCTDNAAMVAWNGWFLYNQGMAEPTSDKVKSRAQWPLFQKP